MHELSSKDIDFVKYFALPDKEIAERTNYSFNTVKTYKSKLFKRMNAASATHALFKAVKAGLITIEEIITE